MTYQRAVELQALIDSGLAWRLEGAVGREAFEAIEAGYCMLGPKANKDYWGNVVPAHTDIKPGEVGSLAYFQAAQDELAWNEEEDY